MASIIHTVDSVRWDRATMGSADRAQRGVYAVAVTEMLTGERMSADGMLTCPLTGERFNVAYGEVDKADPIKGYVPGNIAMVSKRGNQGRSALQQWHGDMAGAARYIADVYRASLSVSVPRKRDALPVWEAMGRKGFEKAVIAGPYGIA